VRAKPFPFEEADRTAVVRDEAHQEPFQMRHDFIDIPPGRERLERLSQYLDVASRLPLGGSRILEFLHGPG
jgi:hypothetical protein